MNIPQVSDVNAAPFSYQPLFPCSYPCRLICNLISATLLNAMEKSNAYKQSAQLKKDMYSQRSAPLNVIRIRCFIKAYTKESAG